MAHRFAPLAFAGFALAVSLVAPRAQPDNTGPQALTVTSPAFNNGGPIPSRYSCDAQGKNGSGKTGWTPPCPPSGVHRYHFKVFALNRPITLAEPSEGDLLWAMNGHLLAQGEAVGTYQRIKK